jgi:multidrug transporter EmrE-like cation transporter
MLIGRFAFNEVVSLYQVLGTALILAGIVVIGGGT